MLKKVLLFIGLLIIFVISFSYFRYLFGSQKEVLTAINPRGQLEKAHDATRGADISTIQHALNRYHTDHGGYTPTLEALISADELGDLPLDPVTRLPYSYTPAEDLLEYQLCIEAETSLQSCYTSRDFDNR